MPAKPHVPASASARTDTSKPFSKGLIFAVAALLAILLLPQPEGLPVAGQRMLAVFCFAVVIAALIAVLLGLSPDVAHPDVLVRIGERMPALAATAPITTSINVKSDAHGTRNNPAASTDSAGAMSQRVLSGLNQGENTIACITNMTSSRPWSA